MPNVRYVKNANPLDGNARLTFDRDGETIVLEIGGDAVELTDDEMASASGAGYILEDVDAKAAADDSSDEGESQPSEPVAPATGSASKTTADKTQEKQKTEKPTGV